ncbi:MAG TPA: hypothetical protein VNH11_20935 [Pirellulales bacterium]|nr:hypothetical protein [Pirellulales bacterium]
MNLESLLSRELPAASNGIALFAVLNLGLIESLANGALGTAEAVRVFYNAENCLFVEKRLRDKTAREIMSRGVQLPDLFAAFSEDDARREFQHELAAMRTLCLKLLEQQRLAA